MSLELGEINVAITGGAGAIASYLVPEMMHRLESQGLRVNLRLLEIEPAMQRLEGFGMEIDDSNYPNLEKLELTADPSVAFDKVDIALLVGSKPRVKGKPRSDLLFQNAKIFVEQGQALNDNANDDVRILVVGNPANSNALVAASNAPDIPKEQFAAMTRLDQDRAVSMVAKKLGVGTLAVSNLYAWGNHSSTMAVDVHSAYVVTPGSSFPNNIDYKLRGHEITEIKEAVRERGAAILEARGVSSSVSAAHAAASSIMDWSFGSKFPHSLATYSHGEYDTPEGVYFSFPVVTVAASRTSTPHINEGRKLSQAFKEELVITGQELVEEKQNLKDAGHLTYVS